MRVARIAGLVILVAWVCITELRVRSAWINTQILTAVSPGMSRTEVVERLGKPSYVQQDEGLMGTHGEILVYKYYFMRPFSDVVMVILDRYGRVVTLFYPKRSRYYPPVGGIATGERYCHRPPENRATGAERGEAWRPRWSESRRGEGERARRP